jgi:hypothetical protein
MDNERTGWVLHRHTLGDGSSHLDLMIGPWPGLSDGADGAGARSLRSWRLGLDPRESSAFAGEDGPDHRRVYLDVVERVLDGGRGTVRRLAGGAAAVMEAGEDRVVVRLRGWGGDGEVELVGERVGEGLSRWRFARG